MSQFERAFGDAAWLVLLSVPVLVAVGVVYGRQFSLTLSVTIVRTLLVASIVGVLAVTLFPTPAGGLARSVEWLPFTDLESAARRAQVLANIALTTPTGVLAAWTLTGKKLWSVVARFSLLPLVIELTQFTLPIGRVAATEDVILGALGILLGATAQRFTRAAFGSPPRE